MIDETLVDVLQRHVRERPDAPAVKVAGRVTSFAELDHDTDRVANALQSMELQRGDRVACVTRHHRECLVLMLGACKAGFVPIVVNWRLAASELEYVLDDGEARLVLVDEGVLPFVRKATLTHVRQWVCTERAIGDVPAFGDWYASHSADFSAAGVGLDAAALQLYSSGTTGRPKGVVLTHGGLMSASRVVARDWNFGPENVLGNPLPVFHIAGMSMLLTAVFAGGTTISFPEFDPADFIVAIGQERITHSMLVPAMLLFILQTPEAVDADLGSLHLIAYGGSPISDRLLKDAIDVFGCDFLQVYGLTEISGPATFLMPDDHRELSTGLDRLRSAGCPVDGVKLRIVDPITLQDLPPEETGEVWIQSTRNMKEYWRNPEATNAAFPEGRDSSGGWFRTGDGGYLDEGYLYIQDRIKDMIISGGENIYPAEVENILMTHPAVADGAVIGVPDETWGEAVKACVVAKPGVTLAGQDIIDFLRERIAHYKCPRSVDFVEALPRNPSGKILKRVLRAPHWPDND